MSAEVKLGFKRTEAGVIPTDWKINQLVELSSSIASGRSKVDTEFGQFPVFGSTGVIGYTNTPSHTGESILVARVGANAGFLNSADGRYGVTDNTIAIRLKPGSDHIYCLLQLKRYGLSRLIFGSGQPLITGTQLKGIPIPIPAPEEQVKIVSAISEIDSLIRSLDQLIAKKRDIQQATMQQLLTGQLRLPGFSEEWSMHELGNLEREQKIRLYRGNVISKKDIEQNPGEHPIYSSSIKNDAIFGYYGKFALNEELITWSVDGGGNFFYRPKHKFSVTNVCGYIRILSPTINCRFLCFQLQQLHSRMIFDYTLKAHPSVIRRAYRVAIPNIPEQTAIAQILSEIESEISALETRRDKVSSIKCGMMHKLLTGEIRII